MLAYVTKACNAADNKLCLAPLRKQVKVTARFKHYSELHE